MGGRKDISVLIVDDDLAFLETLGSILEIEGYGVDQASSGKEALAKARQCRFDYLLLDIRMPEMSGVDIWRELRKTLPDTLAIFMTAYSASDLLSQARREGNIACLTKPFDPEDLLKILEREE
jgi:CheY-like chemotaxis protein